MGKSEQALTELLILQNKGKNQRQIVESFRQMGYEDEHIDNALDNAGYKVRSKPKRVTSRA